MKDESLKTKEESKDVSSRDVGLRGSFGEFDEWTKNLHEE